MRKRIIGHEIQAPHSSTDQKWLDLESLAQVEVTSEDKAHPIEAALIPDVGEGWRAAGSEKQTIRLLFDKPQNVQCIRLVFREEEHERTHEFVLRWSSDNGQSYRELVRQQYNFSPPATIEEIEEYSFELNALTILELIINGDISGRNVCASVAELRIA